MNIRMIASLHSYYVACLIKCDLSSLELRDGTVLLGSKRTGSATTSTAASSTTSSRTGSSVTTTASSATAASTTSATSKASAWWFSVRSVIDTNGASSDIRTNHLHRFIARVRFDKFNVSKSLEFLCFPVHGKSHTGNLTAVRKGLTEGIFIDAPTQVTNKDSSAARWFGCWFPSGSDWFWGRVLDTEPAALEVFSVELNRLDGGISRIEIQNGGTGRATIVLEGEFAVGDGAA
mmetsp:Transcript_14524/g.24074  ORF Transcript_14524/g.24074 Transcript_14524/m.24074 type:complete len:234 (+) Transcript_14524:19-720(+)